MVDSPEKYWSSSVRGHINRGSDPVLSGDCHIEEEIEDWLGYLKEKEAEEIIKDIRRSTMTGRPCGDEGFIEKLEILLNRRLRALPWGRPRKHK